MKFKIVLYISFVNYIDILVNFLGMLLILKWFFVLRILWGEWINFYFVF